MASHLVKCFYCEKIFDTNTEDSVKVNSLRYAHRACADTADRRKSKEEHDKRVLEDYIKKLFGISCISEKIRKQMSDFIRKRNYTYESIYKTLQYFYDVRGHTTEKANGGIGIVPYCYEEAQKYWQGIWATREKNRKVEIQEYVLPPQKIQIFSPKRESIVKIKNSFSFLDQEGDAANGE